MLRFDTYPFCATSILLLLSFAGCGPAAATPIRVYESAAPKQQGDILKESYKAAVADTLSALRSAHFQNGNTKTPERVARDKARADVIEKMAPHLTDRQEVALTSLIDQFANAKPETALEAVISSFLLSEAMQ